MRLKTLLLVLVFILMVSVIKAQINTYVGGTIQGLYTGARIDNATYKPGFGIGAAIYYWEFNDWFFKTGIDYTLKSSSFFDSPVLFGQAYQDDANDIKIDYRQHDLGIPLTIYFRLIERSSNAMLLTGTLEMSYALAGIMKSDGFDKVILTGRDFDKRLRTAVGIGVGYQWQIDRDLFFNLIPSYNVDLRSERPFNTFKLTVEMMFGIY
ncbi:MAG TPA: hypothetical protein ENN61_03545 [Bacteroidaceae bacterium]|nr:hypothetical protein [Bacteroidaceae bacterium]